jgi:hypothetical protein
MLPICQFFVPTMEFEPSPLPKTAKANFMKFLVVAKLLATNARLTARALSSPLSAFDPIVHDNSCQIRAFRIITLAHSKEICEEASKLEESAIGVEQAVQNFYNKPPVPDQKASFEDIAARLQLSLMASPHMIYLLQAHFLTIGKIFQMRPDGSEVAYIDFSILISRLSVKSIETPLLKKIVDFTQVSLAEASIRCIQAEAEAAGGALAKQLAVVELVPSPDPETLLRPCSCAFYNFKLILTRLECPILVKRYAFQKEKSFFGIFYRRVPDTIQFAELTEDEVGKLDPKSPVFVIEGFMPPQSQRGDLQKQVNQFSLLDLALINVARVSQFSSRDLDPTKMDTSEIEKYRRQATELGCSLTKPTIFSIVHTHAGTVVDEKGRLS